VCTASLGNSTLFNLYQLLRDLHSIDGMFSDVRDALDQLGLVRDLAALVNGSLLCPGMQSVAIHPHLSIGYILVKLLS
jgi:hypothetical protein